MAETTNYTAILAALVALVDGVPGTGIVYGRKRLQREYKAFIEAFRDPANPTIINGWTISRGAFVEIPKVNRQTKLSHSFTVRGYYGLNDADDTETTFQGIVNAITDALRGTYDLGAFPAPGPAETVGRPQGKIDERFFGSVLCHYTEIEVVAHELLDALA